MPVAPSFSDLTAQFEAEAQGIRPALAFRDGDIAQAIEHGAAAMADANIRYAAQALRDTFLDGAEGDALTALVDDHYNLQREESTLAQVSVQFMRTSSGIAGTIPSGTTVATQQLADGSEIRYATSTAVIVPSGSNGPFSVQATATIAGSTGNSAPGTVIRVVDSLFDTFSVTNPSAAGGGNDREDDKDLRTRARNFWLTLRRGTLAAIEFGALQVPSVRISKATEDQASGIVTLVVSDSDGNSTAQMIADVQTEIENWRAAPAVVTVTGGTSLLVDIDATFVLEDGADASVLAPLAADNVAARLRKLRQGEVLRLDTIKAAAIAVDPDNITAIIMNSPTSDVTPTVTQVIRPGIVTFG